MPGISANNLEVLRPYLESETPNDVGEVGMHCPLHEDATRSASLNMNTGKWYCHGPCSDGGTAASLVKMINNGEAFPPPEKGASSNGSSTASKGRPESISEGKVAGYHSALLSSGEPLGDLRKARKLTMDTIREFQIGWDTSPTRPAYTIPVRGEDGRLVNIRRYQINPTDDGRKIWSANGHGTPVLFPSQNIGDLGDYVVVCEGELDAILTIQNGFEALTRTGAADVWRQGWNKVFTGKTVFVIHDKDQKGYLANKKVHRELTGVAARVVVVDLPFEYKEKHGDDLTDYWAAGYTADDFWALCQAALTDEVEPNRIESPDVKVVSIKESFNAKLVGQPLALRVAVSGKKIPSYTIPSQVSFSCIPGEAGIKCITCAMNEEGYVGDHNLTVQPDNPMILELMNSSERELNERLRAEVGITPKCPVYEQTIHAHQTVEELFIRPSVEDAGIEWSNSTEDGEYIIRKAVSVGTHETVTNSTVEMLGMIFPNPRSQHNELQAWQVLPTETSMDAFELTPKNLKLLEKFRAGKSRPLMKLQQIARDLAEHVTSIHGRTELHMLVDLVFHSQLQFSFAGKQEPRGWLDAVVVGDTRTGKSEAARLLTAHYGGGQLVGCETASFAGVVGGLQQIGGKEWAVTWGAIPLNDKRAIVLDEVSGLTQEQIGQMSSIRSLGKAELTKIQGGQAWARTRLLWMGNPRGGQAMADYTYGVQALGPLIGNNEDIARFDLAMSLRNDDVALESMNQAVDTSQHPKYDQEACNVRLMWAWSRKPEDIKWEKGVEQFLLDQANEVGQRYVDRPPLVQAANVRIKIARISVALAAATFSSDSKGEKVIITKSHVEDAIAFMDRLYNLPGFGYGEISRREREDEKLAKSSHKQAYEYLRDRPEVVKFLSSVEGQFRRDDLEAMMNMSREEASASINIMWSMRLLAAKTAIIRISPFCHELIRELEQKPVGEW